MRILLLGGISEARSLADTLAARGFEVIYSLAGLVHGARPACEVREGGFGGADHDGIEGMARFIGQNGVDIVVDATHPYAARISANAVEAAARAGVECWRYLRPGWGAAIAGCERFDDWDDLLPRLRAARRPLFTIGRRVLDHLGRQPRDQHWIVRTALPMNPSAGVTLVHGTGPFDVEHERGLMRTHAVDALVTKDSGLVAALSKIDAARDLDIPVLVQRRPSLVPADRCFERIDRLVEALGAPASRRSAGAS